MSDSRAAKRVALTWRVAMVFVKGTQPVMGRTANVSEGGLAIISPRNAPAGTQFALSVLVPAVKVGAQPTVVPMVGKIVHSVFNKDGCLLGVQTSGISPEHAKLIRAWIEH